MFRKKLIKRLLLLLSFLFLFVNVIAFNHAWKFTHYDTSKHERPRYEGLSFSGKVKGALFGVGKPRPKTRKLPECSYETIHINSNEELECWYMKVPEEKGTVLMFHGYTGEKSSLLTRAALIRSMGYSTVLVDFMGAGGSEGDIVTIGYKEAENVLDCYKAFKEKGVEHITLYGVSMGAAAILKAVDDEELSIDKIILEAPFGTMLQAVENRFSMLGVPSFPLAQLLVFWGGVQHGYWGFGHKPAEYAKAVKCPTLIIYGERDRRVRIEEVEMIANNIKSERKLVVYPESGHVNFLGNNNSEWQKDVSSFLNGIE